MTDPRNARPRNKNGVPSETGTDLSVKNENFSSGDDLSVAQTPPQKSGKKKVVFYLIFFLICAASLAFTAFSDFSGDVLSFQEIIATIGKNWFYLVFAALSALLVLFFDWLKTVCLLYGFEKKPRFKLCAETAVITKFYDYITPFGAGGQPFAAYLMTKKGVHGGTATAVVISAFLLQQFSFIILCIVSLILSFSLITPAVKVMALVGLFFYVLVPVAVFVFSIMPKATTKIVAGVIRFGHKIRLVRNPDRLIKKAIGVISKNTKCLKSIGQHKLMFVFAVLCALLSQLALVSIAYFTLRTFGYDNPNVGGMGEWLEMIQIVIILYSSVSFIPTPGNAGASEVSFFFIFRDNLQGGLGFTAMLTWRILCFYLYILLGGCVTFFSSRLESRHKKREELLRAAKIGGATETADPSPQPERRDDGATTSEKTKADPSPQSERQDDGTSETDGLYSASDRPGEDMTN